MIKELKEILKKEAMQTGNSKRVNSIESSTTLVDLGYTFVDAIKKLKEAGATIILTEEEKEKRLEEIRKANKIINEDSNGSRMYDGPVNVKQFENTSDIIAVHKTDYAPKNERIESRNSGGVLHDCTITLGGKEYNFTCKSARNSVHLSANHEVGSNNGGSWDKTKYAVVIPFDDLKKYSTIKSAKAVDIYTSGAVKLTENSYILCPKGESTAIQKDNPNITVIEYEGEYVQDYADILISELGYKLEIGNDYGFENAEQAHNYHEIMTREGFTVQSHSKSEDKEKEMKLGKIYQVVGLMKLIRDEQLMKKMDREELIEQLNSQKFFQLVDGALGEDSPYNDEFVGELKKLGINVSIDNLRAAFESHKDEDGFLDVPYESIVTGYMLDAIAERDKTTITSKDFAEVDKSQNITTSETNSTKELLENLRENMNDKVK